MRDILVPGVDGRAFLRWAMHDGWVMQNPLIQPAVAERASYLLRNAVATISRVICVLIK